jgi:glutamate-1-semialdehyde aminotransferase
VADFSAYRRAQTCIAGGTASDVIPPEAFASGVYPSHIKHGRGAIVVDQKGTKYLDFMACGGNSVFGCGEPSITQALTTELLGGVLHSLPTHHEYECAEALKDTFTFVDQWKFFKTERDAELFSADIGRNSTVSNECETTWWTPRGCPSGWTGNFPDVIVIGGALASGLPLYAVGGKYDTMRTVSAYHTDRFSGEVLALVAAKTTARLMQSRYDAERLLTHGKAFTDEFNSVCPDLVRITTHLRSMGDLVGPATTLFCREACRAGMLFGAVWRMSFPMIDEYKNALTPIKAILNKIKRGELRLEGEMPL